MRKAEQWPSNHGRLKKYLEPSDRIYYRKINTNGNPESVGAGKAGKDCIALLGIKEIEGLEKIGEFRGRDEHQGVSLEILKEDIIFSCGVDSRGYPASLGLSNAGKDVTIIVHGGGKEEETVEGTDKAAKIKKLTEEFMKTHDRLNELAEKIKELETE